MRAYTRRLVAIVTVCLDPGILIMETLNNSVFVLRNRLKILCSKIADDFLISNLRKFHKTATYMGVYPVIMFVL